MISSNEFRTRFSVRLCTTVFENRQHPLHLLISSEDASVVGIEDKTAISGIITVCNDESSNKIESRPTSPSSASVRSLLNRSISSDRCASTSSSDREIFVQLCVIESVELMPNQNSFTGRHMSTSGNIKDLQLMCSDSFQDHYDILETSELYFRQVNLFPLQKIIFSVNDRDAFEWLQKVKFSMGLLVEVCENDILVSKGDVFLSPYPEVFLNDPDFQSNWFFKMQVLECLPLQHGKMGINTQIILCYEDNFLPPANCRMHNISPSKNIFISDFCNSIRFADNADVKSDEGSKDKTDAPPKYVFNASFVENHGAWRDILDGYDPKDSFDVHSVIGISRSLMVKYGFFDGSMLKISVVPEDEPHLQQSPKHQLSLESDTLEPTSGIKRREKLVMVKSLTTSLKNHKTVYVSPVVLFNLQPGPVLVEKFQLLAEKLIDLPLESDVDEGCQSLSSSWSIGLPIAKKVEISLINSPYYSPQTFYSQAIKKYFTTPRLISLGDVFSVKSSDDPEFWQSMAMDTGVRFPIIFFKVIRIESSVPRSVSHIVDSKKTMLLQKGSIHSYVPKISFFYLSNKDSPYWHRLYCPGLNNYVTKLESLVLPFITQRPCNGSRITVLPTILLSGPVGCGKMTVIECATLRLSLHMQQVNCHDLIGETAAATESRIKNCFLTASVFSPCVLVLKNIHALGKERGGQIEDPRVISGFHNSIKQIAFEKTEYPLVVIATTNNLRAVSEDMNDVFLHDIIMEGPSESDRFDIIEALVDDEPIEADLSIKHLAQRTAGFVLGDLVCLVAHARREAYSSTLNINGNVNLSQDEEEDLVSAGVILQQKHFEAALDKLQTAHSDAIGAPKIPNVTWDDVGGLSSVKSDILDTVQLPLQHPELLAAGLKRSGVLLYGPPGTGKTLLAKAVATECSLNFLSVKGPELINMYVGQSEENIREVFKRARSATPCVIFFDELDSLAPNRGKSADSGGVMDRVVSQLLAELDGLGKSCDVFVIGATNRPDLLDPALLRPGRFDKLLYLGISEDRPSQLKILKALTRKFHIAKACNMENIVSQCPWNMTGADFYALSSDAMLNALKRKIQLLEDGKTVNKSDIIVQEQDFINALKTLIPSVSDAELTRYKTIRDKFEVPT
ncbi:peroxisomal ATPase PEX6 [Patella vulgata]|uniref:peroxisomal ATPase PEX6 n=1 Tax=Patella vulgata TaxID=6465 RepID=UPI0024A86341|nr:peroxisomal ATPase PEX6 [Patella vulgata]